MALKAYRFGRKKKVKKKRRMFDSDTGSLVKGGITALVGVGLLSLTADAVGRV